MRNTYDRAVLDLRRLRYFLAVADELNFSRAAERLGIAQPALSRQIRQLEAELGVELLHRTTHTVEPTEAGVFVSDQGRALIEAADALFNAARAFATGERGAITLGFGTSAGYETAPRLIEALRGVLAEVRIESRVMGAPEILAAVAGGALDIGLVRCPERRPDLESTVIRRERQGVLLRADDPLAQRRGIALESIGERTLLVHARNANAGHYDAIVQLFEPGGAMPRMLVRDLAADLTHAPIVDGRAIAVAGESVVAALPRALKWVPLTPSIAFDIHLLTRRDSRVPLIQRVLDAARVAASSMRWMGPDGDATGL
jgi:DNA-binding transcriptional LysR family regulator